MMRTLVRSAPAILFAEDFDAPRDGRGQDGADRLDPEVIEPGFSAAELEAARGAALAEGRQAALAELAGVRDAATTRAAHALIAALDEARTAGAALAEQAASATARLILAALTACLPALCARFGDAEVAAVLRAILPSLAREPALRLRLNPAADVAGFAAILALHGGEARIRVEPAADIAAGDVAILWPDGAVARDAASIRRRLADALAGLGLTPADPSLPSLPLPETTDDQ